MKFQRVLHWIAPLAGLGAAVWLLLSGLAKISDPSPWEQALHDQQLISGSLLGVVAAGVPWLEAILAVAVVWWLTNQRLQIGLVVLALWFTCLAAYAVGLIVVPPPKPAGCGCGLSQSLHVDWRPLAFQNAGVATTLTLLSIGVKQSVTSAQAHARSY